MRQLVLSIAVLASCTTEDDEPFGGAVPGQVSQAVTEGGPNPTAIVVELRNSGTCLLSFSRTVQTVDGAGWLGVTPISGSIMPNGGTTNLTITLDVISTALTPGTYTGTIVLTGTCMTTSRPAAGSPLVIAVNLTVKPNLASISTPDTTIEQDPITLANTWSPIGTSGAPSDRSNHTSVWTGFEMIVWGGSDTGATNTGGRYEPVNGTWTSTSTIGAPEARHRHVAVWASTRMVIWGGVAGTDVNTGGIYSPNTNSWTATSTTNAPFARSSPSAVWAGNSLNRMIVWGGGSNTGGRFDPFANVWLTTTVSGAPSDRSKNTAIWTGTRMLVWGGRAGATTTPLGDGGAYDPVADSWQPITTFNAPSPRSDHIAVWTGTHMIIWGGTDASGARLGDGALYDPIRNLWIPMTATNAPSPRAGHTAVWNGSKMIVCGGDPTTMAGYTATGAVYDPVFDAWTATSTVGAPARTTHTAIWNGTQMLTWGGSGAAFASPGAIYQ